MPVKTFCNNLFDRCASGYIHIIQVLKDCYNGPYVLEIVNINKEPQRAIQEKIIYTPLLIKEKPFPSKRLMGDMSDRSKVIAAL